ncbi:MAG TPA: hypothetical protein VF821_11645 [Lentzea sp.]
MATSNEIRHRIEQIDAATSTRRVTAAQRVSELADRRRTLATELEEIDTELGEVVTEHADVISLAELAAVTDIPASELTTWISSRKPSRAKRKRPTNTGPDTKNQTQNSAPSPAPASDVLDPATTGSAPTRILVPVP